MPFLSRCAAVGAIALIGVGSGVLAQENSVSAPTDSQTAPLTSATQVTSTPPAPDQPFKPGDAVQIFAYPDTMSFLNGIYTIDAKGCIMLPFDGPTPISGMSEAQLTEYLTNRYVKYLLYPQVHVRHMVRLAFLGGFQRPGLYYVDPSRSLWEAFSLAGVPQREDGIRLMRWERGAEVIGKKLGDPLEGGMSLADMGIKSGDQICVTSRPKRVFSEIFQADIFPWISLSTTFFTVAVSAYQFRLLYEQTKGN